MHKPIVSIIVAMDEKRGIGKNNALMWKIPGELARFKEITMGHPIIMGRKTFDSIGRVLPGRLNIVISRNLHVRIPTPENLLNVQSLDMAIQRASEVDQEEIFIIGGGQIFEQALPLADRLYLTLVKGDFDADVFFPPYEKEFTKIIESEEKEAGDYSLRFLTLER
jgi:dihydrofolate reductase